jgi:hypothetical protein
MLNKTQLLLSVSVLLLIIANACSRFPSQYYNDGVSDDEYIRIASETGEARAFMSKYPSAEVYVDRDGRLAVDFRFNKVIPFSTEQTWEGIRLRVFIDARDKKVSGAFLDCKDSHAKHKFIEGKLVEYLEQYDVDTGCP